MFSDYAQLEPGQELSRRSYQIDEEMVRNYVEAVQDRSAPLAAPSGEPIVPPMAVAALSLRGVVEDLRIPGGTLHAGQEFQFSRAIRVGQRLECVATLAQNSVRGEWRFMAVNCRVTDSESDDVMSGKSSIMIPAGLGPTQAED